MTIHAAYVQLGFEVPDDLLQLVSPEWMVELIHALNRALLEEETMVRVYGTGGMAYVLAVAKFLFAHDMVVSVGNFLIYEGARRSIFLEFTTDTPGAATFQLGARLQNIAPLLEQDRKLSNTSRWCQFLWPKWIRSWLELEFASSGATCSEKAEQSLLGPTKGRGLTQHSNIVMKNETTA
ncbi:hypothetical protein Asppvi_000206 [Aspergillus pseudoviridinutans]|uniref:Uncharacterized protein n=1 Tax=Aspergillus pseudoviridinutans TaxID=1517512 RepID=A0A9P3B0T9_9EURO|nr:uncharacterized protein Asppvi_000206 [Aspergillus pseudoviridinutans]GIJ81706.1 hypothetical protein Asppvi_000206 [Aspergillus pseudoviridinutans]